MKNMMEKVTINLGVVDLGYIDLLVSNGHFSNRTDFIKNSIRASLAEHKEFIDGMIQEKKQTSSTVVGVSVLNQKEVNERNINNESVDLVVVGLLILGKDINKEQLFNTYNSIKVYGSVKADSEIKQHYDL